MSQNSKRIWPYSSSWSSKVIDLGVNGKSICDFLLVINCNLISRIGHRFEIFTFKDRKLLILPTPPLFEAPARGEPLRISGWNLPRKNQRDGATVWWKLHDPSFNRFWDIGGLKAENLQICLPWPLNPGQGSLKVIDFGTNGKLVYTFLLLVINSNFSPILHRFGDMAT